MLDMVSPEQQRLIIEKLYRSEDSITSTSRFNRQYEAKLGPIGKENIEIRDFARLMKKTEFKSLEVEQFIKDITGYSIDLETLEYSPNQSDS